MNAFKGVAVSTRSALTVGVVAMITVAVTALIAPPSYATTQPTCNTVMVAGSSWLGGHGVNVYSNGPYTGSSGYCKDYLLDNAMPPKQYGWGWQCVELVERLYMTNGWITALWPAPSNGAASMYAAAPSGLRKEPQGSISSLKPGDAVVFNTSFFAPYGHIAVVGVANGSSGQLYSENTGANNGTGNNSVWNYSLSGGTLTVPNIAAAGKITGVVQAPYQTWSGVGSAQYLGTNHLGANQRIYPNQYLLSGNGLAVLTLQSDGNLVEYAMNGQVLWQSRTSGQSIAYGILQTDGNFVLYRTNGSAAFDTHTGGTSSQTFVLQNDGNIVLYQADQHVAWSTYTVIPGHPEQLQPTGSDRLTSGARINPGQFMQSSDHPLRVAPAGRRQPGSLRQLGYHVLWNSHTGGQPVAYGVMQGDGNFVLYRTNGQPAFDTHTWSTPANRLVMQNDGNLVLYDANGNHYWASWTNGKT